MRLTYHDGPAHGGGAVASCRLCHDVMVDVIRRAIAARALHPDDCTCTPCCDRRYDELVAYLRPMLAARAAAKAWGVDPEPAAA